MSRFIRKVKTASGATAVQIITKSGRQVVALEHIGSAHTEHELDLLVALAKQRLHQGQLSLLEESSDEVFVKKTYSRYLYGTLSGIYHRLGFDVLDDDAFKELVLARIIEPSSKADTTRILSDLGLDAPGSSTLHRALGTCIENNYRDLLADQCFAYVAPSAFSLLLYDVTTLYFEVQKEDEYRRPGMSKERRLEPQIVVGLLVDSAGFPLSIASFEGNKAETLTLIPVLEAYKIRYSLTDIVVTADAAMLSSANLEALEDLGYHYIVASRLAKCPYEIECIRKETDDELADGQIIDTAATFTINHKRVKRRIIYQYKEKRSRLDLSNIDKAIAKAEKMIAGSAAFKRNRFLSVSGADKKINWDLVESAKARAGIKGYVTNLSSDAQTIINAYHQLFEVERSFRMSKSDLKARPIFHRKKDAIEAHLTIVFAALAISRYIQSKTGISIKRFIQRLAVIRDAVISVNGAEMTVSASIPADVVELVNSL
jgi:hypothetical protein